nr:SDR family NAD(P)-dependent oxidoreductase [Mucilaginibacter humi]
MKKVLITGANKSIGFETAKQLLKQGYFVYPGSRDETNGREAIAQLKAEGLENVELLQIDVSNPESVAKAAAQITELDVLINNAGILGAWEQAPTTAPLSLIKDVFETNFLGR